MTTYAPFTSPTATYRVRVLNPCVQAGGGTPDVFSPSFRNPITGQCGTLREALLVEEVARRQQQLDQEFADWSARTGVSMFVSPVPGYLADELSGQRPTTVTLGRLIERTRWGPTWAVPLLVGALATVWWFTYGQRPPTGLWWLPSKERRR